MQQIKGSPMSGNAPSFSNRRRSPGILWILMLLLKSFAQNQTTSFAAPLESPIEVFHSGTNGIKRYRIPGMVVSPRGTILAYAEARRDGSDDWGEIEIHLRRSTDSGKTWSASQHIAHSGARLQANPLNPRIGHGKQTVNNPVAIVDRHTGAIEFLYCVHYARCFSMRSLDDGATWSKPVEITASFEDFRKHYDWKVIATGPGHGIQLRKGRLLVPIWLAFGKEGDHHPSATGTLYSDDHGKTWIAGSIAVHPTPMFNDPNESVVAELSHGEVLLVTRNESKANRKIVTTSPDGATRWSEPKFHPHLWEPICMASLISHPSRPGTLVFSNPHTLARDNSGREIPGGRGKRENLTIKLSRDNGSSWPFSRSLDPNPSAYSDLAVLPDGSVLCLYEAGQDIRAARFTLEWIEHPP